MRVWASAHAIDDLYQGLVPAAVPYFVLERHYSYAAASGLALAATLGSAFPQLLIGLLADRHPLRWMSPLGLVLAGVGAGLAGLVAPTRSCSRCCCSPGSGSRCSIRRPVVTPGARRNTAPLR